MENLKQGNDSRQNCQKPDSTWQKFEEETNILTVFVGADDTTGIYYQGKPAGYFNGAVRNHAKADYFVGDDNINGYGEANKVAEPVAEAKPEATAEATSEVEAKAEETVATTTPDAPAEAQAPEASANVAPATEEEPIDPTLQ